MGCGCRKNALPLGPSTSTTNTTTAPPTSYGSGGGSQTFELKLSDGSTQTFGTRLEAQAQRVRLGDGSIRRL